MRFFDACSKSCFSLTMTQLPEHFYNQLYLSQLQKSENGEVVEVAA